jgi:hypothetical protein
MRKSRVEKFPQGLAAAKQTEGPSTPCADSRCESAHSARDDRVGLAAPFDFPFGFPQGFGKTGQGLEAVP